MGQLVEGDLREDELRQVLSLGSCDIAMDQDLSLHLLHLDIIEQCGRQGLVLLTAAVPTVLETQQGAQHTVIVGLPEEIVL